MTSLRILILLVCSVSLSSCISYQYVALRSELPVDFGSKKYYIETDSVRITYDFRGVGLTVNAYIFNNTSNDLYVDLRNSVYAENGRVVKNAVGPKTVQMSSVSNPDNLFIHDGSMRTDGQATTTLPSEVVYIPPGMYAMVQSVPFGANYSRERKKKYSSTEFVEINGVNQLIKRYNFHEDARTFDISFRVSSYPNLSNSRNIKATFKEDYLYNLNAEPKDLPGGTAKYYSTYKKHPLGAYILLGALGIAGGYAIVSGEE